MLYPPAVMVLSAFKSNAEIFASPFALPESFDPSNLLRVWNESYFVRYLTNSAIVTGACVIGILIFGTMAAYAIARYPFRFRAVIFLFFLSGLMIPLKLAVIPLFIQLDSFGLIDRRAGLVLVYIAMGLPSCVFIMTGCLRTLPGELEESAPVEGACALRLM